MAHLGTDVRLRPEMLYGGLGLFVTHSGNRLNNNWRWKRGETLYQVGDGVDLRGEVAANAGTEEFQMAYNRSQGRISGIRGL